MSHRLLPGFLVACAHEREPAPAELDALVHEAYEGFEDGAAVGGIAAWLAADDGSDAAWDGLRTSPIGRDPVGQIGVATAFQSVHPPQRHAARAIEEDQTWLDPSSFEAYARTVIEGDAASFAAGRGVLRTTNDIVKGGPFGVTIAYTLRRDFRWTQGALVSRWWLEEPGCSPDGDNCVVQSFGLDVLVPADGGADRLLVNWIEAVTAADALLSEDARVGLVADGNQDLILAVEEALGG